VRYARSNGAFVSTLQKRDIFAATPGVIAAQCGIFATELRSLFDEVLKTPT
jgi:hypothetical protein